MPNTGLLIEDGGVERAPFSAEFQAAVRSELDTLLKAPIFAQSGRCKRFLHYVVIQTLSGNAGELKERTIGITVFERTSDYDTGDDSIVRVTANEVRKRLGQYYGETAGPHPVQIELPRGSYVPEFKFQAPRKARKAENASVVELSSGRSSTAEASPEVRLETPATVPPTDTAPESSPKTTISRTRLIYLAAAATLIIGAALAVLMIRDHSQNSGPDLWNSFLHPGSPVLVCIDTHQLPATGAVSKDGQAFVDMVLRKQIVALDDAAVLSSMAALLGKKEIPFRVVAADQVSLADLRRQPVILIGAIDNPWTIRLTKDLPYRIEVSNPPGSGAGKEPVASIVDNQHSGTRWSADLGTPFKDWKSDYAVIAKVDDVTTGVPVLIEAGLGNDGTLAASELIATDRLSASLASVRSCRNRRNFEVVIETQIIDTKSGPPHVLRLTCW
ncbi:hypothetical protein [Occallatibacter riparius]|uniref:Adenylate cyclase n=1 Tax=Occallatibacter riparius TaxID=1002689 RepID=A0A9J7BGG5_9BACT|nr:hypothetical protein [Occallatibacter riparius]UWZ81839.1 hypothetical protein MOP44_14730 [Occallatibacter riparius]